MDFGYTTASPACAHIQKAVFLIETLADRYDYDSEIMREIVRNNYLSPKCQSMYVILSIRKNK